MSSLRRLLRDYRLLPEQFIRLDSELLGYLEALAVAQQCSIRDVVVDALYAAVRANHAQSGNDRHWHTLTPREQQIAALTCLGYTNHQIAAVLFISVNTVRTHMRGVLDKYQVASKAELRLALADWDFTSWLAAQNPAFSLPTPEE